LLDQLADAVRSVEASSGFSVTEASMPTTDFGTCVPRSRSRQGPDTYLNEYGFRLVTGFDLVT
jgi:hypothetical protein